MMWSTKDGRRIRPGDMSYGHIVNTMALLRRRVEEQSKDEAIVTYCRSKIPIYGEFEYNLRMRAMG